MYKINKCDCGSTALTQKGQVTVVNLPEQWVVFFFSPANIFGYKGYMVLYREETV